MALVPAVTDITSRVSTWDASGIINAVRDHIFNDTTHLAIDDYNTSEGLTIGFQAVGEVHQVNFRKNAAATIDVSIEPSGSITDAGNSTPTAPTGTSADWSGEIGTWDVTLGSPAAGSKAWIVELSDAFFIMITDTTNLFHVTCIHAGRVYTSWHSSDAAANGQDGLGWFAGVPDAMTGATNDWLGASSPCSSLHWATNEWSDHADANLATSMVGTTNVANPAHTTYRPLGNVMLRAVDIGGNTSDQFIGPFKYMRATATTRIPKSLVTDTGSNQAWMHYNDTTSLDAYTIIWDKTVTP